MSYRLAVCEAIAEVAVGKIAFGCVMVSKKPLAPVLGKMAAAKPQLELNEKTSRQRVPSAKAQMRRCCKV